MVKEGNERICSHTLTSLSDALKLLRSRFSCSPRITLIAVQNSFGKITAEAIFSPLSVPVAHLSAMDGIAVKSVDTIEATQQKSVTLTDSVRVNTGNVVPDGYDSVIMIEDTEERDDGYHIQSSIHPWQHIRPVGEDIVKNEMILPRMSQIRASDIGALVSYGVCEVPVFDLKIALIPTGNEIVPIGTIPQPGQVIGSNMKVAAAFITAIGATVTHYPAVPDDPSQIKNAIEQAAFDHDIILISAGSSKGTKDYTASVIADLGTVFVHGIAMIPAKTVILGEVREKPVIGMPGYPIASYTVLREIVLPLLGWYGFDVPEFTGIPVCLANKVQSSTGFDEFVLAMVGKVRDTWVAVPFPRGAGIQMHMVRSNAYLKVPPGKKELKTGAQTTAFLTVRKKVAEQVVLITGSHDPSIDYLADLVRDAGIRIASSHVGSMEGLLALQRGACHLAPMHLLADDGEYNIPYLHKHFPDEELALICIGERIQGIVSREILGFEAITTHRFINRQGGSGTRKFLDHMLKQKRINPGSIIGYDQEVPTHLGVCLAVQNGDADLGMTIYSAARAFSLPFVPVDVERYELVTTKQMLKEDRRIRKIADMIKSQKFKEVLIHLGGYEIENTGTIRWCNVK